MPFRKFWIFTLVLMQFGKFLGHLHYIFTLMGCQRGVTRHPNNPASDAYGTGNFFLQTTFFKIDQLIAENPKSSKETLNLSHVTITSIATPWGWSQIKSIADLIQLN